MPPPLAPGSTDKARKRIGETIPGSRVDFGISGESLQIKLTGTSLITKQPQRDSLNFNYRTEQPAETASQATGVGSISLAN